MRRFGIGARRTLGARGTRPGRRRRTRAARRPRRDAAPARDAPPSTLGRRRISTEPPRTPGRGVFDGGPGARVGRLPRSSRSVARALSDWVCYPSFGSWSSGRRRGVFEPRRSSGTGPFPTAIGTERGARERRARGGRRRGRGAREAEAGGASERRRGGRTRRGGREEGRRRRGRGRLRGERLTRGDASERATRRERAEGAERRGGSTGEGSAGSASLVFQNEFCSPGGSRTMRGGMSITG